MAKAKLSVAAVLLLVVVPLCMYTCALLVGIQLGRTLERGPDSAGGVGFTWRGALHYVTKVRRAIDRSIYICVAIGSAILATCSSIHTSVTSLHAYTSCAGSLLVWSRVEMYHMPCNISFPACMRRCHKKRWLCLSIVNLSCYLFQELWDIDVLGRRRGGRLWVVSGGVRELVPVVVASRSSGAERSSSASKQPYSVPFSDLPPANDVLETKSSANYTPSTQRRHYSNHTSVRAYACFNF